MDFAKFADARFVAYVVLAALYGANNAFRIALLAAYACFTCADLLACRRYRAGEGAKADALARMCLYAVIMPNSNVAIAALCVAVFLNGRWKRRYSKLEMLCLIWLLFELVLGLAHPASVLLSAYFWIAPLVLLTVGKKLFTDMNPHAFALELDRAVVIQAVSVAAKLAAEPGLLQHIDFDWVYGTFGPSLGVQLYLCMAFAAVFLLYAFATYRETRFLVFGIGAACIALLTGSIAVTLLTFAAAALYFCILRNNVYLIIGVATCIAVAFGGLLLLNKDWVAQDIMNLANPTYALNRIPKLQMYPATFATIPAEDAAFALAGEGLGRYSSRAALALTGDYIGFVTTEDMSDCTARFVAPLFWKATEKNLGTAYMPFSEICTIAGETGIIGLVLFLALLVSKYRRGNSAQKLLLVLLAVLLFYDNYLEFPRFFLLLAMVYRACGCLNLKETLRTKRRSHAAPHNTSHSTSPDTPLGTSHAAP